VTFYDFLSLKNDVNVPSKSNKQKTGRIFITLRKKGITRQDITVRIVKQMARQAGFTEIADKVIPLGDIFD
jgi:hypothetical protein